MLQCRYGEGVTSNAPGTQRYQISPCPESAYIGSAALHEQLMHSDLIATPTGASQSKCGVIRVFPATVSRSNLADQI
jgi:hypothetical protein